jgi:adenylate cyclase class IV
MEIELKLGLVDAADLERLLGALPAPTSVVLQRNHYFSDPAGLLDAARVMLRVREDLDPADPAAPATRVVVTAKRRTDKRAGVFVAEEHEAALDPGEWLPIRARERDLGALAEHPVIAWLRAELGPVSLAPRGALDNLRRAIPCQGLVLEVDRTTFSDGSVDAEVEVETDDALERAREVVEAAARRAGVALFDQTKGKYRRYLERAGIARGERSTR